VTVGAGGRDGELAGGLRREDPAGAGDGGPPGSREPTEQPPRGDGYGEPRRGDGHEGS
jgi:hypothetical protein